MGRVVRFVLAVMFVASGVVATPASGLLGPRVEVKVGVSFARVADGRATLGNGLVERRWTLDRFKTLSLTDLRSSGRTWGRTRRDFALGVAGLSLGSDAFSATGVRALPLARGGVRVEFDLRSVLLPVLTVRRAVEVYPGIAGFRTETTVSSSVPLVLSRLTLEEVDAGVVPSASLTALRSGADWREPGWQGPTVTVGDEHAGTWRETQTSTGGAPLRGAGQWLSLRDGARSLFVVLERNDFPSSVLEYDGTVARSVIDHSRDVVSLGPFEGDAHVENPLPTGETRVRTILPGRTLRLAPVFTGFGDHDADEPWQFHRYLTEQRLAPYPHAVTFNSNGVDADRISTGAKDDMDHDTVVEVADVARRLGVETFILDDGWQARSGDWQPDSPQYPEPRWDGTATSKFKPRFRDATFAAVREAIAPMRLGLWMTPTFFNPSAATFAAHPLWACQPLATPLAAVNLAQPDSGSNEAGIVPWSIDAFAHAEARIREAITQWDVEYFKFDFLAWLDCLSGSGVHDMYEMQDAFLAMLDRVQADHPTVTLQIDETNDYRLFPYGSVVRGPSWFQNGHPEPRRMLHNLWNLSPFVPAFSVGQNALADENFERYPVDALMAGALLSHMTFFSDIRELPEPVVQRVASWTEFYRSARDVLDGVVYPLLDDPLDGGWTALQAWNPDAGEGALLAFRQGSQHATERIALRNVADGTYELVSAPDGVVVGTRTGAELRAGVDVTIPDVEGASVVLIKRR
jgi:hypothetical protein